jgi:hypothetical protein
MSVFKANYLRSEGNTLDRKKIIFKAKGTRSIVRKLFLKQTFSTVSKLFSKLREHVRQYVGTGLCVLDISICSSGPSV